MKEQLVHERTCLVCRGKNEKNNLFRMVKRKDDKLEFDEKQKKDGRGYYICKSHECLKRLAKHKKIKIEPEELMKILNFLKKNEKDYLNVLKAMKNSQELAFGMNMVLDEIEHIHFVVMAEDISEKNEKRLLTRLVEKKIPYVYHKTKDELGEVFNKDEISVIAIKNKKMARGLLK